MSRVTLRPAGFYLLLGVSLAAAATFAVIFVLADARGISVESCYLARCASPAVLAAVATGASAGAWALTAGSPRLILLAAVAERVVEAVALGAIAWIGLPEAPRLAAAAITAMGASYLAAYLRVRSMGLDYRVTTPTAFRMGPLLLVTLGLLAGRVEVGLWAVVVLSVSVLAMELAEVARQREHR